MDAKSGVLPVTASYGVHPSRKYRLLEVLLSMSAVHLQQ